VVVRVSILHVQCFDAIGWVSSRAPGLYKTCQRSSTDAFLAAAWSNRGKIGWLNKN